MHIYEKPKGKIILQEIRTDLAFESRNFYLKKNRLTEIPGIEAETLKTDIYTVTRVSVESDEAAEKIKKPVGKYITIHSPHISTGLYTRELSLALSKELSSLMPKTKKDPLTFVAGLGNSNVTPDSIGPLTLSSLIVTRHIKNSGEFIPLASLSALCPGVLGITGIESAEILSSVSDRIKPDVIIAIDALASRSASHVGSTIQLSDSGISPGSGVNNRRNALNSETFGLPVIALGVPTVSDSSAVLYDAMKDILSDFDVNSDNSAAEKIISAYLHKKSENMMVTPKNIDAVVMRASAVLSRGINLAVHKNLLYEDIADYIS